MAQRALRPCRHPGCNRLTRDGWCDAHRPKPKPDTRSQEAAAWHRWYSLDIWTDDLRPTQLLHEPWCRECAKNGQRVRATVVDHIEPHRGDWARFIDSRNLQSLCKRCHDRKTALEMAANRRSKRRR